MRRKRARRRKLLVLVLLVIIIGIITFFILGKENISLKDDELIINKDYKISELIKSSKNAEVKDDTVSFNKAGENTITINYKNRFGQEKSKNFTVKVVDNSAPTIDVLDEISISVDSSKDDILEKITAKDDSNEKVDIKIEGDYDLSKAGSYEIKIIATDSANNKTEKSITLKVTKKNSSSNTTSNASAGAYYVKVNKTLNVAMVYGKDSDGNYTKLEKTFLVSTGGENTPTGIFTSTDRYETLSLVGDVWGHYTIRIDGAIWFHSVPYFSKPGADGNWDDLEYEEFNKLGTTASKGCVRLSTADAKWLYENLPWHTKVEIYESDELPDGVTKPVGKKIDTSSENRGWDPTDPDPDNPWNL